MKYLPLLCALVISLCPLPASEPAPLVGEGETNWPGIQYQILFFQRIPPERLLVGVRIFATAKAPLHGTLVGTSVPIPANANKYDVAAGYYHPLPLSLSSSVMVEDATQQKFLPLPPVAPPGKKYRPSVVLGSLTPGQALILTLQFAVPPPPPPPPLGQPPVKQTVSFLFTNAKGPIAKIPIPPPVKA